MATPLTWLQQWVDTLADPLKPTVVFLLHCPIKSEKGVIIAAPLLNDPYYPAGLDAGQLEAMEKCATTSCIERIKGYLEVRGIRVLIINTNPSEANCVHDVHKAARGLAPQLEILQDLLCPVAYICCSALVRDAVELLCDQQDPIFQHDFHFHYLDWHLGGFAWRHPFCLRLYPPRSFVDVALFRANVVSHLPPVVQDAFVAALFEDDGAPRHFRKNYRTASLSEGGTNYVPYPITIETRATNPNNLSPTGGYYGGDDGEDDDKDGETGGSLEAITSKEGELYSPERIISITPGKPFSPLASLAASAPPLFSQVGE